MSDVLRKNPIYWSVRFGAGAGLIMMGIFGWISFFLTGSVPDSRNWVMAPCTILWNKTKVELSSNSQPGVHSVAHGTTLYYSYEWDGKIYIADQFNKVSRCEDEAVIARKYVKGEDTVCYVNPTQPSIAVLTRKPGSSHWTEWFYGSILMFLGACLTVVTFFAWREDIVDMSSKGTVISLKPKRKPFQDISTLLLGTISVTLLTIGMFSEFRDPPKFIWWNNLFPLCWLVILIPLGIFFLVALLNRIVDAFFEID